MKKWILKGGGSLWLETPGKVQEKLENVVYSVENSPFGFYLVKVENKFEFPYKIYGLETGLVKRVKTTYPNTTGNLGILLNGIKGTGKTVTSKIICNTLNQPVIVVNAAHENVQHFLNSIPQNITIFIDEYEKIFDEKSEMLTIMDGAMNSEFRRVFILTTNNLYINENLLQRPGRIRYLKTFDDLHPEIIEEIVDDLLVHKSFRDMTIKFISSLEIITVDIVKAVIEEVNIHNEDPKNFQGVFNVKKRTSKYDVFKFNEAEKKFEDFEKNVSVYPRDFGNIEACVGRRFEVNGKTIGFVEECLDKYTFKVKEIQIEVEESLIEAKSVRKRRIATNPAIIEMGKDSSPGDVKSDTSKKKKKKVLLPPVVSIYKIDYADAYHSNYRFKQTENWMEMM